MFLLRSAQEETFIVDIMIKKLFLCLGLLGIAAQASDSDKRALLDAIESNDIGKTETVLKLVPEPDRQELLANAGWDDRSALSIAALNGNKDMFMWLIQSFGLTPAQDISTLFNDAARGGNLDIIKHVYSLVPEENRQELIDSIHGFWGSPLVAAAQSGHPAAVDWLLQNGSDTHAKFCDENVLYAAVEGQNVEVLDFLFKHIQDKEECQKLLTFRNSWGCTILMNSAIYGNKKVFERLIDEAKTLDIDFEEYISAKNNLGDNVFFFAVVGNSLDILKYLLELLPVEKCLEMINSGNNADVTALDISRCFCERIIGESTKQILEGYLSEYSKQY